MPDILMEPKQRKIYVTGTCSVVMAVVTVTVTDDNGLIHDTFMTIRPEYPAGGWECVSDKAVT